jgi:hypothetical protein
MKPKSFTRTKKAAFGAAATGVVFSLQHQADAAIVYSGVQNVAASVPGATGGDTKNLDINGGGNDLRIMANATAYFSNYHFGVVMLGGFNGFGSIAKIGSEVKKLASGANISAALGGWHAGNSIFPVRREGTNTAGFWTQPNQTGFAPFRLNAGSGNYQYGWIRLKWTDSAGDPNPWPNTITAIDWAYESTLNTTIQAGAGAAVPEPSRALLALAGLGAMALRRRRKKA